MEITKPTNININLNGNGGDIKNNSFLSKYPWPLGPWIPICFPFPIPTSGIPIFMKGQETGNGIASTFSASELSEAIKIITEVKVQDIKKANSSKEINIVLKSVYSKFPHLKRKFEDVTGGDDQNGEIMGLFWAGFVAGVLIGMAAQKAYDYFNEDPKDDDEN